MKPEIDIRSQMKPSLAPTTENPAIMEPEGAMAKADLYRAGKSAIKLFKLFDNDQQLEGWVQTKISKAADYLDNVYHYMEYQMKFGPQGGPELDDSMETFAGDHEPEPILDIDDIEESTSYEATLVRLLEASKKPVRNPVAKFAHATTRRAAGPQKDRQKAEKRGDTKHKGKIGESDVCEISDDAKRSYRKNAGEAMRDANGDRKTISKRLKGLSASLATEKEKKKIGEAKPSSGLSAKQKSSTVKAARAGKDIGKPGKKFEKVADKAAKQYGSAEKGKKVAAAAMWKNKPR